MKSTVQFQHGQSMTEFLVIMPVMLLLIFGAIQFIFIYQAKTTLNYATFEATRAGSLENASLESIENGFTRGITPLFTRFSTKDNKEDDLAAKVLSAREIARDEVANGFVKIELLNPTSRAFSSLYDPVVFANTGEKEIPNDNLSFRRSPNDALQDANLLKLRITYCMKLIVPVVNSVILEAVLAVTKDSFEKDCLDNKNRFPIVSHAIIRMQTPARECKGCFANN